MTRKSGSLIEWILPLLFIFCAGHVIWNFPRFIISFGWASDAIKTLHQGAGALDFVALILLPVFFILGAATISKAPMEYDSTTGFDRVSLFIGRITMMLVGLIVLVMFYEVTLRYVFERPTLWANELSLWMAGFVFLLAGLYAMQQRSHIRIFILYDVMPRPVQKLCDVISTVLIILFAAAMVWGGFKEAYDKLLRWETFGTAFDPPIPATLKPMVLLIICLVAIQAVSNLILDWSKAPEHHDPAEEAEEIKKIHEDIV